MVDIVADAPVVEQKHNVNVGTVEVRHNVIGPASPIDTKKGTPIPDAEKPDPSERTYTKENFLAERSFVGQRLATAFNLPPMPVSSASPTQEETKALAAWQKTKAVYDRFTDPASQQEITGDDWNEIKHLQITFPPIKAGESQAMQDAIQQRQTNWLQVIDYYYGEGTSAAFQEGNATVHRGEANKLGAAARALGFITTGDAAREATPGNGPWWPQFIAESFDNILTPQEIIAAMPDFGSAPRAILTPDDFDPTSQIWQGFLTDEAPALLDDHQDNSLGARWQRTKDSIKRQQVFRVYFLSQLQSEIEIREQRISEAKRGGDNARVTILKQEQDELVKKQADFKSAEKLGDRSKQLLENMQDLYQGIPAESAETQQAWLSFLQETSGEVTPESIKAKIKALAQLLGIADIDALLTQMPEISKAEMMQYGAAKLGAGVMLFASVFVLLQFYQGAKSGAGQEG